MTEKITLDTVPTQQLIAAIITDKFKNRGLCKYLLNSDLQDSYIVAFYNAKNKYRSDANTQFSTYVYQCIVNMALKNLKKKRPTLFSELQETEIRQVLSRTDYRSYKTEHKIHLKELINIAGLTTKELDLIKQKFYLGRSSADIAKTEKVTRQRINQRLNNVLDKLREADQNADYEFNV